MASRMLTLTVQPGVDRAIVSRPVLVRPASTRLALTKQHRRARTETEIDVTSVFSPRREPVAIARTLSSSRSVQVLARPASIDLSVRGRLRTASHLTSQATPRMTKSSSAPSVSERAAVFGGSVRRRCVGCR